MRSLTIPALPRSFAALKGSRVHPETKFARLHRFVQEEPAPSTSKLHFALRLYHIIIGL
jgi:hypothetical protein